MKLDWLGQNSLVPFLPGPTTFSTFQTVSPASPGRLVRPPKPPPPVPLPGAGVVEWQVRNYKLESGVWRRFATRNFSDLTSAANHYYLNCSSGQERFSVRLPPYAVLLYEGRGFAGSPGWLAIRACVLIKDRYGRLQTSEVNATQYAAAMRD